MCTWMVRIPRELNSLSILGIIMDKREEIVEKKVENSNSREKSNRYIENTGYNKGVKYGGCQRIA